MIYQVENGITNTDKIPLGGIVNQYSAATSMMETIANPITYYVNPVINQAGHSRDLYDYYWTSYSRGTDGNWQQGMNWHNVYLDGYIPLRVKSIYDPCPYLYRIPSNGTYNQFGPNAGWTIFSYLGGVSWNINTNVSWLSCLSYRHPGIANFNTTGERIGFWTSNVSHSTGGYMLVFFANKAIQFNCFWGRSEGFSVRCIEDCDPKALRNQIKNRKGV